MIDTKEVFHDRTKGIYKPLESYIHPVLTVFETVPIRKTLVHLQKIAFRWQSLWMNMVVLPDF